MDMIKCAVNGKHTMEYREFDDKNKNGFYCTTCFYTELDKELTDDLLKFQAERRVSIW